MHSVTAFPAPALPLVATCFALLFPTLACFVARLLALTGVFSSLLIRPVSLGLCKRGRC